MEVDKYKEDRNTKYNHSMTLTWDYPDFDGGESVTNYRIDWNQGKSSRTFYKLTETNELSFKLTDDNVK